LTGFTDLIASICLKNQVLRFYISMQDAVVVPDEDKMKS